MINLKIAFKMVAIILAIVAASSWALVALRILPWNKVLLLDAVCLLFLSIPVAAVLTQGNQMWHQPSHKYLIKFLALPVILGVVLFVSLTLNPSPAILFVLFFVMFTGVNIYFYFGKK